MFRQDLSDALAASFFVKDLEGPVQLFHGDPLVFDEQLANFLLLVVCAGVNEVPILEVEARCIARDYESELAGERGQVKGL